MIEAMVSRLATLFAIVLLLLPSSVPAMGKVCASKTAGPNCCCADSEAPAGLAWSRGCCCHLDTPAAPEEPAPRLERNEVESVSIPNFDSQPTLQVPLPLATPSILEWSRTEPRGPPGPLHRLYGVFLC